MGEWEEYNSVLRGTHNDSAYNILTESCMESG